VVIDVNLKVLVCPHKAAPGLDNSVDFRILLTPEDLVLSVRDVTPGFHLLAIRNLAIRDCVREV